MKKKLLIVAILLLAGAAGVWTSIAFYRLNQGEVVNLRRTFHYPTQFVNQLKTDPRAGEKVYQEYCASCHAPQPLIDVRAPRLGSSDWKPYCHADINALLAITNRGIGAMPSRGGCFECDDALLEKAIRYMRSKSC